MATLKFKAGAVEKVLKNLDTEIKKYEARAIRAMKSVAIDLQGEIRDRIEEIKAVDTGALKRSVIIGSVKRRGEELSVVVFSGLEYAEVIEYGRQKGKTPPPLQAIVGWAKRKGFLTKTPTNANLELPEYEKEISTAFAMMRGKKSGGESGGKKKKEIDPIVRDMMILIGIQRAIKAKGTKGRGPFRKAFFAKKKTLKNDFIRAF